MAPSRSVLRRKCWSRAMQSTTLPAGHLPSPRPWRWADLRLIWRSNSGIAAVEFAMLVPIIAFMFLAMADLGIGIYTDMQVNNAAQYGTAYALLNGYDSDAISNAIKNGSGLSHLTISPSQFCGCPA